jgi:hypothetical protein
MEDLKPHSTAERTNTQNMTKESQKTSGWYSAVPPVVKLTRLSPRYALQRLRDRALFGLVRDYLGYFARTKDGEIVRGESRVTAEVKIRSEGMPVGPELMQLYCEYLSAHGITKKAAMEDLDQVDRYMVTARRMRVQAARESERKFMQP